MQTEQIVATLNAKRGDLFKVPSSFLRIKEGFNIRQDYGDIEELKNSIKVNGVLVPMRGYKDKEDGQDVYVITNGHRRQKACQLLLEEGTEILVPFILEAKGYSDEQRLIDTFLMNDGKSLTPLEQAEGVRRLIAYSYTEKEIAGKLAKSEGYIRKLNSLNTAPKKFIKLIEDGSISATLAIEAIAKGQVEEVMSRIEENKKPVVKAPDDNTGEFFDADGKEMRDVVPSSKITKKHLQKQNSVRDFKKFMKKADENLMSEDKLYIYQFAAKLMNDEVSLEEIEEFFQ